MPPMKIIDVITSKLLIIFVSVLKCNSFCELECSMLQLLCVPCWRFGRIVPLTGDVTKFELMQIHGKTLFHDRFQMQTARECRQTCFFSHIQPITQTTVLNV